MIAAIALRKISEIHLYELSGGSDHMEPNLKIAQS